jgi:hypothetical protein
MTKKPDLGDAGQVLWDELLVGLPDGWELDERELSVLRLAAEQADVNAQLQDQLDSEGLMSTGSKGQPVLHPGVAELRLGRLAIDRMLGKITLPAPEKAGAGQDSAGQRAQKAAEARWSRHGRVKALRRG